MKTGNYGNGKDKNVHIQDDAQASLNDGPIEQFLAFGENGQIAPAATDAGGAKVGKKRNCRDVDAKAGNSAEKASIAKPARSAKQSVVQHEDGQLGQKVCNRLDGVSRIAFLQTLA